jgi:hypothetical protein
LHDLLRIAPVADNTLSQGRRAGKMPAHQKGEGRLVAAAGAPHQRVVGFFFHGCVRKPTGPGPIYLRRRRADTVIPPP